MDRVYTSLGEFTLESGVLRISDPGYDKDVWCTGTIENCKTGQWDAAVVRSDEGIFGTRNGMLVACHQDLSDSFVLADKISKRGKPARNSGIHICDFTVGVDSGQAGIYDDARFGLDETFSDVANDDDDPPPHYESDWYDYCCAATDGPLQADTIPFGVFLPAV